MADLPKLEMAHTMLSETDALRLLEGHRITRDGRTMDPKAQIVGEFVKSIRVPGVYPPLPELRQQLVTMTQLMDEPAPALPRVEDLRVGNIPARLYSPQPAGHAPLPVLAYFHGGGWVQGDLQTHNGLCARLALWSGAIVVAIDYRLAPENKFPAAVDDCLAAYRWLRQSGGTLGIDTTRVAVGGDSAGGNLSAVVSQQAKPVPSFQVLIYPALDFAYATPSHRIMPDAHILPKDRIDWYTVQYLRDETDKTDLRASPLLARDLAGQPPAMIVSCGFDPLRDEAALYAEKLRGAGVAVQYKEWPGQIHGFLSMAKAIPQGLACTREIADYMRQRF
jgi:acetyl esterase